MLNEVLENTERFMSSVPKAKRKKYGQFFTNATTAKFMASLFCFDLSKNKWIFLMQVLGPEYLPQLLFRSYLSQDTEEQSISHATKQTNLYYLF